MFAGLHLTRQRKDEGERLKWDERILGDSSFVEDVLKETDERFKRGYELRSRGFDMEHLAARVAGIFGVDSTDILKAGKYKEVVRARSVFCYWAVRELDVKATELAKRLGMSQPAVSISVKRGEKIADDMGLKLEKIL